MTNPNRITDSETYNIIAATARGETHQFQIGQRMLFSGDMGEYLVVILSRDGVGQYGNIYYKVQRLSHEQESWRANQNWLTPIRLGRSEMKHKLRIVQ